MRTVLDKVRPALLGVVPHRVMPGAGFRGRAPGSSLKVKGLGLRVDGIAPQLKALWAPSVRTIVQAARFGEMLSCEVLPFRDRQRRRSCKSTGLHRPKTPLTSNLGTKPALKPRCRPASASGPCARSLRPPGTCRPEEKTESPARRKSTRNANDDASCRRASR